MQILIVKAYMIHENAIKMIAEMIVFIYILVTMAKRFTENYHILQKGSLLGSLEVKVKVNWSDDTPNIAQICQVMNSYCMLKVSRYYSK